ncbi:MAG TPA: ATPase, T2SS/T4P/T4SS family [Rhizomicrobium sp.]|nr:ATPase, T2SS/T4P/T4SS family [Rhizomicrobium sp.]
MTVPATAQDAPTDIIDAGPRRLTDEDGISIPADFLGYILLIEHRGLVTIYVEKDRADDTNVTSVKRSLERRAARYPRLEIKPLHLSDLQRLQEQYAGPTAPMVSAERTAIQLLRSFHEHGATDAALKQHQRAAALLLRVDGDMTAPIKSLTKKEVRNLCQVFWNMSDPSSRVGDYSETTSGGTTMVEVLADYGLADIYSAVRFSYAATSLGPECAIRLQAAGQTARPLEELGHPAPAIIKLRQTTSGAGGAIFISGPVGSGKTNLLASTALDVATNRPEKKMATIEDPAEVFIHESVSQWIVTGRTPQDRDAQYNDLIRRALRSDLEFLILGECRGPEAANAFLQAAVSGMIGLSTIHTPNAMKIIRRLAGWGIDAVNLTDPEIMRGLGAVRLIKTLCDCKIPIAKALRDRSEASDLEETVARLQRHADMAYPLRDASVPRIMDGYTRKHEGCEVCRGRSKIEKRSYGIRGRTQIIEYFDPDARLLELLVDGHVDSAHQHARSFLKIPSIQEDALDRVAAGDACPLDIEDQLGLFQDPKKFAGSQIRSGGAA